ncbi:antA/AntB antirepressor family protein [Edwardsiella piscicida]|uniref:antA/AntB antirepressor family protein n=1 Tax=Edwardsiella piscicida TaxID=1263550 RepID=UPI001F2835DF|nr:antA/AntB antirepressor family protein [Edwardsiella piscicida]UJT80192.1 antA/AntB antirepressor family protein [Edwardsiella piscicida]
MNTSVASSYTDASSNHHVVNEFADIVPVVSGRIGERETSVVSGTSLHKALGVATRMTDWIKRRIGEYGFKEGLDYIIVENLRSPNLSSAKSRQQISHEYLTTLDMAKELAMVERSEQGRAIRRYFIQCEEALQLTAPEVAARYRRKLKARIGVANLFKPMCSALESVRAEQGKVTQSHHYSNESNMISRIVLGGLTAKQWAGMNGLVGDPRDSMNAEQLEHLSYLESTNITLLDMGMDYLQRKVELTRLSQRWMARRLGAA